MTKEITKSIILQQIEDKFKLREFVPGPFLFEETVIPTYDIGPHLVTEERQVKTLSITSAASYAFFTVPENERWLLHRYNVIFVTGAYTVAGVFLGRPVSADYVYLDLTAAQSVSYAHNLPNPALLMPNQRIYVMVDGYTTTGDLDMIIDATVEKIR